MAGSPRHVAGRSAVVRDRRTHPGPGLGRHIRPRRTAAPRGRGGSQAPRFAPHQLRHAHAVELAREGVAVNIIQRQLGHTDLGTTSTYLQGIDPSEIIDAVRSRRQPTISATAGLTLLKRTGHARLQTGRRAPP